MRRPFLGAIVYYYPYAETMLRGPRAAIVIDIALCMSAPVGPVSLNVFGPDASFTVNGVRHSVEPRAGCWCWPPEEED